MVRTKPSLEKREEGLLEQDMEKLRLLNIELTKENAHLRKIISQCEAERLALMNDYNRIKIELQRRNIKCSKMTTKSKVVYDQFVNLSGHMVEMILIGNNSMMDEDDEPGDANALSNNKQQTQAVKPMVSGHVIEKPVINLQRVSPEELERMSQSVRERSGSQHEEDSVADNEENMSHDEDSDIIFENNGLNGMAPIAEDGEEEDEEAEEAAIEVAVAEERQEEEPTACDSFSDVSVDISQMRGCVNTRKRANSARKLSVPSSIFTLALSPVQQNMMAIESLSSTSSTTSESICDGKVVKRRGRPRKLSAFQADSISSSSSSIEERQFGVPIGKVGSNTSLLSIVPEQFSPFSLSTSKTSTPAKMTIKRRKTLKNQSLKNCTVVLERIALSKTSPKKSVRGKHNKALSSLSEMTATGSENNNALNGCSSTTLIKAKTPISSRPGRKAKPTSLKELPLNSKLRRDD